MINALRKGKQGRESWGYVYMCNTVAKGSFTYIMTSLKIYKT